MRMRFSLRSSAFGLLTAASTVSADAQDVRRFETYGQALNHLLGDPTSGQFRANTCGLTSGLTDLTILDRANDSEVPIPDQIGPIGQNLSRHCIRRPNIFGGSVLGSSLSSSQSTRTVSQFDDSRPRGATADSNTPTTDDSRDTSHIAELAGYQNVAEIISNETTFSLKIADSHIASVLLGATDGLVTYFGAVDHQYISKEATRFETAAEFRSLEGEGGIAFHLNPSLIVGLRGTIRGLDETDFGPRNVDSRDFGEPWWSFNNFLPVVDYEEACGVPRDGSASSTELGVSVFGVARIQDSGFVAVDAGIGNVRRKYDRSLCLLTISGSPATAGNVASGATPTEIYSGVFHAEQDGYQVSAQLRSGYDFEVSGMTIGPRVGIQLVSTFINSYGESETAGATSKFFFPQDGQFATGTALRYDPQNVMYLQSRLGFAISRPIPVYNSVFTPFVDFNYVHEFANDQRDITVRFVEDDREDPLKFSFKTNTPDRDFFEVGGGIYTQFSGGGSAFARGNVIVGNNLYNGYGFEAGLSLAF